MEDPIYIEVRKINKPEIIIDKTMDLEKLLSQYKGKIIGLVKAHNLKEETRSGKLYHEGRLVIDHTTDDKGNPIKAYYVERDDSCGVPIDLGDGLFLDSLPTQPYEWSPKYN